MRILISGASGLIGGALRASLDADGHETVGLSRRPRDDRSIGWNPDANELDETKLEGFDAVVHLAAESISGRWSPEKKRAIRESRTRGTGLLATALAGLASPPSVFVSASAMGFYGDRGETVCDESTTPGTGFFPEVCVEWEAAAAPARPRMRVVHPRSGIVLSLEDGALAKLELPLKLGIAGPAGSGRQWWSWISIADEVRALRHLIETESLEGPVNLVAAEAVRNQEFMRAAGRAVNRPAFLPAPAFALRLALGEMADHLLLASTHVVPKALLESGFEFADAELEPTLRRLFGE